MHGLAPHARLLLLPAALLRAAPLHAQAQRATTETGRAVLLRPDGTWIYAAGPDRGHRGGG